MYKWFADTYTHCGQWRHGIGAIIINGAYLSVKFVEQKETRLLKFECVIEKQLKQVAALFLQSFRVYSANIFKVKTYVRYIDVYLCATQIYNTYGISNVLE